MRPPVLLGHLGTAVAGMVLLVAYLAAGRPGWTTTAVILTASCLGAVTMLPYWWRRRQALRACSQTPAYSGRLLATTRGL
jgi:hypothetical protein